MPSEIQLYCIQTHLQPGSMDISNDITCNLLVCDGRVLAVPSVEPLCAISDCVVTLGWPYL